jgi:DNA-directed RNA polymerase specialized sigma24 family protein
MRPRPEPRRRERAFARSYRRNVGDIYHYALGILDDDLAAEAVTRTTFVNAYREFRRTGGPPPDINALLAIAHEVCRLRGRHRRPSNADLFVDDERRAGAVACYRAELAVSRRLDDRLARCEKRLLRRHLRSCERCRVFAASQERQREAVRALGAIPLPETLRSLFGPRPRRFARGFAARLTALAATTVLVAALISSGGVPSPSGLIGQERGPEADAAIDKRKPARAQVVGPAGVSFRERSTRSRVHLSPDERRPGRGRRSHVVD